MRERTNDLVWRLWWRARERDAAGQSTVEYAIVTAAIAVAAVAAVAVLDGALTSAFQSLVSKLPK